MSGYGSRVPGGLRAAAAGQGGAGGGSRQGAQLDASAVGGDAVASSAGYGQLYGGGAGAGAGSGPMPPPPPQQQQQQQQFGVATPAYVSAPVQQQQEEEQQQRRDTMLDIDAPAQRSNIDFVTRVWQPAPAPAASAVEALMLGPPTPVPRAGGVGSQATLKVGPGRSC